jgi:Xaa-Pro dipeptidase
MKPERNEFSRLRGIEAAFPRPEFQRRQARARQAVEQAGHDCLVVTEPENIFWLSGRQTAGYFAFQALILPVYGSPVLLVRELELPGAAANTWLEEIIGYRDGDDPVEKLASLLAAIGCSRPAMELGSWFLSHATVGRVIEKLGRDKLADGSGLVGPLRLTKCRAELDAMRSAAHYAEVGIRAGIEACSAGNDENAVAAAMLFAATAAGSEAMAMEPLVSSGPRSGLPHMTWRRRRFAPGDPIFLEMAGSHHRYHAALMRTVWIGQPPAEAVRMMDCALRALDAAIRAIVPGAPCSRPHEAAHAIIAEAGYENAFRKRIGYSMGIAFAPDWGEGAILSLFSDISTVMEPGMVFHLPATLRSFGNWTVGASETVIVTESGAEPLSSLPRSITLR